MEHRGSTVFVVTLESSGWQQTLRVTDSDVLGARQLTDISNWDLVGLGTRKA